MSNRNGERMTSPMSDARISKSRLATDYADFADGFMWIIFILRVLWKKNQRQILRIAQILNQYYTPITSITDKATAFSTSITCASVMS